MFPVLTCLDQVSGADDWVTSDFNVCLLAYCSRKSNLIILFGCNELMWMSSVIYVNFDLFLSLMFSFDSHSLFRNITMCYCPSFISIVTWHFHESFAALLCRFEKYYFRRCNTILLKYHLPSFGFRALGIIMKRFFPPIHQINRVQAFNFHFLN